MPGTPAAGRVLLGSSQKKALIQWSAKREAALQVLEDLLVSPTVLQHLRPESLFGIDCDASGFSIDAVLKQLEEGKGGGR
jgi:hypothetical protein